MNTAQPPTIPSCPHLSALLAQATPGEWKQEGQHIWSPTQKANVASVSDPHVGRYVGYQPVGLDSAGRHEAWANARLLSLAPELGPLASALENLIDDYGDLARALGLDPREHQHEREARAALASLEQRAGGAS